MKKHLLIATVIFILMSIVNILGSVMTSPAGNFAAEMPGLGLSFVFVAVFCVTYFFTTLPHLRLNTALRLPLLRTLFWTFLLVFATSYEDNHSSPNAILYADGLVYFFLMMVNSGLCSFYKVLVFGGGIDPLMAYGVHIFLFAVYEYLVIRIGTLLGSYAYTKISQK